MKSLLAWLPECPDLAGVKATDLTLDSREVSRGSIFVAMKGIQFDGHAFIDEAISKGAVAVLCEQAPASDFSVPVCEVPNLRSRLGELAHQFFGEATQRLRVVGITGTNGKTSCCQFVAQALDFLGKRCGVIGTNGQGLWGQLSATLNTTPDVIRLHEELARQLDQGAEYSAMEVSSHGLHQGRVDGIQFRTAVFTNLSRDHLDYHKTMQAYGEAKWRLMQWPGLENAVVNLDDEWVQQHQDTIQANRVITYSLQAAANADVCVTELTAHAAGMDAQVETPEGQVTLNLRLLGRFNLSNALAALAVLLAEGIPLNTAARIVSNTSPVKGRMELLRHPYSPTVVVDYAHTPDALAKALQGCREHVTGRLVVIFGCGGDRDAGKRPEMARVADQFADAIVVTDDNPRTEASQAIIKDILTGFAKPDEVSVISDRREAIEQTLARCDRSDVILIAGKGHESYQEINGVRHPFSDQETVMAWQEANDVE